MIGSGSGTAVVRVQNPATGRLLADVPSLDREATLKLVGRARAAQAAWRAAGFAARGALMRDMRKWLIDNRRQVIQTLVDENGKPYEDAQLEFFYCADALGFWARQAPKWLADERERPHSPLLLGGKVINRYIPYGVVGVIGPWNYPLLNNFGDAIPALMAGNSVVLKPASITPLSSLLMAEGMRVVGVPEDVFLVGTGCGSTIGRALVDSVDMLHFTGSTQVGKQLMEQAAKRLLPVTLELGGKDPMIVLRDANLERAANAAVWGALQNAGQTCISIERVYVETDAYEPFLARVLEKVARLRQGPPDGPGDGRYWRDHICRAGRRHRGAPSRRGRERRQDRDGRQAPFRARLLLRAHGANERRSLDEDHVRGDLRPDSPHHASGERRGGRAAGERLEHGA